jgi:hypothetical protein
MVRKRNLRSPRLPHDSLMTEATGLCMGLASSIYLEAGKALSAVDLGRLRMGGSAA